MGKKTKFKIEISMSKLELIKSIGKRSIKQTGAGPHAVKKGKGSYNRKQKHKRKWGDGYKQLSPHFLPIW